MNDVEMLREAWDRPEPPGPAARSAARDALLARATRRRPRRRWVVRALAVAASAVAIATVTTLVRTTGEGEPAIPAANAQVMLIRIATAVQNKTFTPPRDDQWIYTEQWMQSFGKEYLGKHLTPRTRPLNTVEEFWTRADGKQVGYKVDGELQISDPGSRAPENTYALLAALPTDPDALLAEFRKFHEVEGVDQDDWLFERFAVTLSQNIVPPDLEAAIFRAIAELPGVTVNGSAVDADGRAVLSVSRVVEGWRDFEILLDPATYAYRGRREIAIRDYEERYPQPGVKKFTMKDGKRVPMAPHVEWSIEKGTTWRVFTRTRVGIVNEAGQKP
ncbi:MULTISPECIES: CU044_5270 family protein [unclassified Streptosporangium]|uniref:CU044_5270 family protein n=1 Tax=unclassified Streptosporangium TaxID=2632669 RepID=UPI002E28A886|nr:MULTISPECIES: CU044_5270 family protein [unclassified Streptosporangium]